MTPPDDEVTVASELVSECLPRSMWSLDRAGMVQVGHLLRERLDAGWTSKEIRCSMDQPLPADVRRLSVLVVHRLMVNVDPSLAPGVLRDTRRKTNVAAEAETISAPEALAWGDIWMQAWAKVRSQSQKIPLSDLADHTLVMLATDGLEEDSFKRTFRSISTENPNLDLADITRLTISKLKGVSA